MKIDLKWCANCRKWVEKYGVIIEGRLSGGGVPLKGTHVIAEELRGGAKTL